MHTVVCMDTLATTYLAVRTETRLSARELEPQLWHLVARGRVVHPELAVDPHDFIDFIATRTAIHDGTLVLGDAHLADMYLACAAMYGVAGAAERVEALCIAQAKKAIVRIEPSPSFVAEIQQRVREKLLVASGEEPPRIAEYSGRGTLVSFVRVAAIREALSEKRSLRRRRFDTLDEPHAVIDEDPTIALARHAHVDAFLEALRTALGSLDSHERAALYMSYFEDQSVDQIGRLFNVHRATAARWITRAQSRVRLLVRLQMQERLQLDDVEAESLLADLMTGDAISRGMLVSNFDSQAA